jgi:hypothetical protein
MPVTLPQKQKQVVQMQRYCDLLQVTYKSLQMKLPGVGSFKVGWENSEVNIRTLHS